MPSSLPSDITLTPVHSSTVKEIGYQAADRVLVVRFHSSPEPYCYRDVPEAVWRWLQRAPSIGKFLHTYIKGKFAFTRVYPVIRCQVHETVQVVESGTLTMAGGQK